MGPVWELAPVGEGGYREGMKEDEYGRTIKYSCVKMEK
jgi:hypothetical protein